VYDTVDNPLTTTLKCTCQLRCRDICRWHVPATLLIESRNLFDIAWYAVHSFSQGKRRESCQLHQGTIDRHKSIEPKKDSMSSHYFSQSNQRLTTARIQSTLLFERMSIFILCYVHCFCHSSLPCRHGETFDERTTTNNRIHRYFEQYKFNREIVFSSSKLIH
jgi:hypothetical protein